MRDPFHTENWKLRIHFHSIDALHRVRRENRVAERKSGGEDVWRWDREGSQTLKVVEKNRIQIKVDEAQTRCIAAISLSHTISLSLVYYSIVPLLLPGSGDKYSRMLRQGFRVAWHTEKLSRHPFCSTKWWRIILLTQVIWLLCHGMVLGEWQRSGYRRRVFFSSQTHCGTARQLEWRHRSSQLQSTGLFWGGRGAEHFLSKHRRSAPLRRWGIIFIGAEQSKRVEPRKKSQTTWNYAPSHMQTENLEKRIKKIFWSCWCHCLNVQDGVPRLKSRR